MKKIQRQIRKHEIGYVNNKDKSSREIRKLMEEMNLPRNIFKRHFTRIIFCEDCGILVENIKQNQKYCEPCSIKRLEIIASRIYKVWADKVKARDGKCKVCGSTKQLEAHHIIPKLQDPSKARKLSNGITLCAKCHREGDGAIHRILGHVYTEEQWATWINTRITTLDDF